MSGSDKDLYSGLIRLHVLHHAAESPIYGSWMIEELREHGYEISPGTLYPMLHGLARKGYLKVRQEGPGKRAVLRPFHRTGLSPGTRSRGVDRARSRPSPSHKAWYPIGDHASSSKTALSQRSGFPAGSPPTAPISCRYCQFPSAIIQHSV